ncbi:MAG: hypothetical protein JW384_00232 [Nitrosomonadaceae bacterium]|nr:hypothetical protein [Nitrosomonadaceae bacterium]
MSCGIAIAIRVQSLSKCDQVCSWPIVTTQVDRLKAGLSGHLVCFVYLVCFIA